jgi:GMP synthase-like glutamine amidotransferase
MALAHRRQPHFGVQFHPESYLTGAGMRLIGNFLNLAGIAIRDVESSAPRFAEGRSG